MRFSVILMLSLATLRLLSPAVFAADQETGGIVYLQNGDRISGNIVQVTQAALVVETTYAGKVTIERSSLLKAVSKEPLELTLTSGRHEIGTAEITPAHLRLGEKTYDWADVVEAGIPSQPEEPPGFFKQWDGNLDFTYSVSRGNTNLDHMGTYLDANRRTPADAWTVRLRTLYSRQDGNVSGDLQSGRIRYDRFVSERWFFFGGFMAERDDMESLRLRTRESGGFGYRFTAGNETVLSVFGGLSAVQEKFGGLERMNLSEAGLTAEFRTLLFGPLLLIVNSDLQPRLSEDRYLFNLDTGLRVPLIERLTIGFQYFTKYDSAPPSAEKQTDYGFQSTVGLQF